MLNPSSPAQKMLSEEDSSGSDVGSEAGLEHETDRFGFILTNGSTASVRSAGPPPELVRQREAKWIHIIEQWDRILLKKTSKVKMQCQKGIPASLRAKCWPLLCGATDRMKQNKDLYKSLDSQPALQSWVDVIERDLDRQFPFHEMFLSKDGHGQRGLFRVLKAYTQFQPEEGYCQAQGPVAAVLLMNMPAEEAFWCLVQISEQYLPGYYSPLLEGVLFDATMLTWMLKRTCPSAHKHLQHYGVEPLMFATDWLMCLFTRHLPFNTLLRVWDLFFCYGVRVLLQVAVVLVRRVLGRAEQRKQCQGQMETLERLRSIRDEVQEEDDAFIAEVCSVPLSTRDLQRHTEKELEKWRKDKPSSTFDPRGRCQGYQMAWTKARQTKEEWERKEREKGNLSVPLARSASTLSLSPSLLHKRWRKGGKANAGEWEGGSKVIRHLSMGAKEDWQSWTDLNFRKVQDVQEEDDVVFEEHKKQTKPELKQQTEQKECTEGSKSQSITTQQVENKTETIVNLKREVEEGEPEQQEGQPTGEDNLQPVDAEYSPVETDTTHSPVEEQSSNKQEEETDSDSQSQIPKELSKKAEEQETEVCDIKEETETHESKCAGVVEENQTEITTNTEIEMQVSAETSEEPMEQMDKKPEERTEIEDAQKQVDTVIDVTTETEPQVITEASPDSESDAETQAAKNTDDTADAVTQQEGTETDNSFEVKYQSTESLEEPQMKEEPHTQTGTETDVLAQTQVENAATLDESETEIDSQQHSVFLPEDMTAEAETTETSDDCIQQESVDVAENDTEVIGTDKTVTESNDAPEPPEPKEEICLTVHSMAEIENDVSICDQNETEEAPVESEITNATVAPPHNKEMSTKPATPILTSEPDGKTAQIDTCDESASKTTKVQEEQSNGNIQEEDDDSISTPNTPQLMENLHTDNNPQVQNKEESDLVKEEIQNCGRRSSRSSSDFCLRKSASSRESRLARKLSEDLFTTPQKTNQSVSNPADQVNLADLKCNPGDVNTTQSPSSVIRSTESLSKSKHDDPPSILAEINEEKQPQTPSKRFGLFRRLRGDQPKKTKTKAPKMQVPKILIQDFSDEVGIGKPVEVEEEEKLSSRERRRRRRERERQEKEEERLRKKKEKELEKEKERDRRKPQTRGKSFQVQTDKGRIQPAANTGSQTLRYSASFAESYF